MGHLDPAPPRVRGLPGGHRPAGLWAGLTWPCGFQPTSGGLTGGGRVLHHHIVSLCRFSFPHLVAPQFPHGL